MVESQYSKADPETIKSLFSSIAGSYDRTNSLLSLGLHRFWNRALVQLVEKRFQKGPLLDLCCGTGAIATLWLRRREIPTEALLLDFCPEMLLIAKERTDRVCPGHYLSFIEGDAHLLPITSGSIEVVTTAYGVRNLHDIKRVADEVLRVLKPRGTWAILELTRPTNPLLRFGHSLYLKTLLPLLGGLSASNQNAYSYLSSSVRSFIAPSELLATLQERGFTPIEVRPLLGGTATLFVLEGRPS